MCAHPSRDSQSQGTGIEITQCCMYAHSLWTLCIAEYESLTDEEAECLFANELHRTCEELEETIAFFQKQMDVWKEEKAE